MDSFVKSNRYSALQLNYETNSQVSALQ